MFRFIIVVSLTFLFGCARSPLKNKSQLMRTAKATPVLQDDLGLQNLAESLKQHIEFFSQKPEGGELEFGPRRITRAEYLAALQRLVDSLSKDPSGDQFFILLKNEFEFLEVYGDKTWGDVFITSYYEPVIQGSSRPTARHTQALYARPKDMVIIDWGEFQSAFPEKLGSSGDSVYEQKSSAAILRGRLVSKEGELGRVVPYYSRQEIDENYPLGGKELELAWVDPVDAFFLQIQGSGVVQLENGKELRVGYAAQNGHSYVPIGKFLFDFIPREKMSMQSIRQYLSTLAPKEQQRILNLNPSYVFFAELEGRPLTYSGAPVIDGRSIATDRGLFPKGALAFMSFEKPLFANEEQREPEAWQPVSRFVFDHDTGGAIRGPHRVDLFWGKGAVAEQHAGVIKNRGRLYYIFPKKI